MDDASGRPLPAGIPGHPGQGRRLHEPVHESGTGLRGHHPAAGPLPAGRRHPVFRHPHRSGRHGPGPVLRDRRGAALSQGGEHPGRHRGAADPRSGQGPGLRDGRGAHHPPRAERPRAAIGFSGSPWTLATYMVEGGSSKDFRKSKAMLYENPQAMHALLDKLAQSVTSYLNGQIRAGAQAVQIFDSWGGSLSAAAYQEFSLAYMKKIVDGLIREHEGRRVPVILFTKGGGLWLESMAETGVEALGLDWTCDIGNARARVGDKVALQGNMDPSALYASPSAIRKEVERILASYGHGTGHVFNLGHGITPEVKPENAGAFIEAVHELSAKYHQ